MEIAGYKTTEHATQWARIVGILAAILFVVSTLTGLLMKSNGWFANGLGAGAVLGAAIGAYVWNFKRGGRDLKLRMRQGPLAFFENYLVEKHAKRRANGELARLAKEGQQISEQMRYALVGRIALMLRPEIQKGLKSGKILKADAKAFAPLVYSIAVTLFIVGHFAIPRIVATSCGALAGGTLGFIAVMLPTLTMEKSIEEK